MEGRCVTTVPPCPPPQQTGWYHVAKLIIWNLAFLWVCYSVTDYNYQSPLGCGLCPSGGWVFVETDRLSSGNFVWIFWLETSPCIYLITPYDQAKMYWTMCHSGLALWGTLTQQCDWYSVIWWLHLLAYPTHYGSSTSLFSALRWWWQTF